MMGFPTFPGPPQGKVFQEMKALPPVVIMCRVMPKEGGVPKLTILVGAKGSRGLCLLLIPLQGTIDKPSRI